MTRKAYVISMRRNDEEKSQTYQHPKNIKYYKKANKMQRGGFIYIMTNKNKTTLYIGVTSNLRSRIDEHKTHLYPNSFTARYNLDFCVYYETFSGIEEAIAREKEIKKWRREKKEELIQKLNPQWVDLWTEINEW